MIAVIVIARLGIAFVIQLAMNLKIMIAVLIFRKSVLHVSKHMRVLYNFIRDYVVIIPINNCSFRLVTIIQVSTINIRLINLTFILLSIVLVHFVS